MSKTAKEMFAEQGLDLVMDNKIAIGYVDSVDGFGIFFRKVIKSYSMRIPDRIMNAYIEVDIAISMELHKAIHQQLRELGWLNE